MSFFSATALLIITNWSVGDLLTAILKKSVSSEMKGSIPPYISKTRKLSVQGEGKVFLCPGKNVKLLIFFPGSYTLVFLTEIHYWMPRGIVPGFWYHFEVHIMQLELDLYLSLDGTELKLASDAPAVLQEELGFVSGKGGRSLLWWRAVWAGAWGRNGKLESLPGLCCSVMPELRCITPSLTVSLSPCLQQVMTLTQMINALCF